MKKALIILIAALLILLASCNDSLQGVLQAAHNATEEDKPNSAYLGTNGSSLIIIREGDVYSASDSSTGEVKYTKLLDITNQASGSRDFPFMAYGEHLYMATNTVTEAYPDGTFRFYRIRISDIQSFKDANSDNQITPADIPDSYKSSNRVTISGEKISGDNIVEFNATNNTPGKTQVLYKVEGERRSDYVDPENPSAVSDHYDDWKNRHYGVIEWTSSTSLNIKNHALVPTNSIIISDGVLKSTTDDPEIEEFKDDVNDIYIWRNGAIHKVYTGTTYYNFPMGSDGSYALLANGELYSIDYTYRSEDYDATLARHSSFTFDPYKREANYVPFFRSGNSIIGYISENGIYWREDITDTSATSSNKSIPRMLGVREDNDIIPLSFIGTNGNTEFLIMTQNNGFYVLQPTAGENGRGKMTRIQEDSGYTISEFL